MPYYYASENYIDTDEKLQWFCRKKSIWTKIKEFLFGKETVDKHFHVV